MSKRRERDKERSPTMHEVNERESSPKFPLVDWHQSTQTPSSTGQCNEQTVSSPLEQGAAGFAGAAGWRSLGGGQQRSAQ